MKQCKLFLMNSGLILIMLGLTLTPLMALAPTSALSQAGQVLWQQQIEQFQRQLQAERLPQTAQARIFGLFVDWSGLMDFPHRDQLLTRATQEGLEYLRQEHKSLEQQLKEWERSFDILGKNPTENDYRHLDQTVAPAIDAVLASQNSAQITRNNMLRRLLEESEKGNSWSLEMLLTLLSSDSLDKAEQTMVKGSLTGFCRAIKRKNPVGYVKWQVFLWQKSSFELDRTETQELLDLAFKHFDQFQLQELIFLDQIREAQQKQVDRVPASSGPAARYRPQVVVGGLFRGKVKELLYKSDARSIARGIVLTGEIEPVTEDNALSLLQELLTISQDSPSVKMTAVVVMSKIIVKCGVQKEWLRQHWPNALKALAAIPTAATKEARLIIQFALSDKLEERLPFVLKHPKLIKHLSEEESQQMVANLGTVEALGSEVSDMPAVAQLIVKSGWSLTQAEAAWEGVFDFVLGGLSLPPHILSGEDLFLALVHWAKQDSSLWERLAAHASFGLREEIRKNVFRGLLAQFEQIPVDQMGQILQLITHILPSDSIAAQYQEWFLELLQKVERLREMIAQVWLEEESERMADSAPKAQSVWSLYRTQIITVLLLPANKESVVSKQLYERAGQWFQRPVSEWASQQLDLLMVLMELADEDMRPFVQSWIEQMRGDQSPSAWIVKMRALAANQLKDAEGLRIPVSIMLGEDDAGISRQFRDLVQKTLYAGDIDQARALLRHYLDQNLGSNTKEQVFILDAMVQALSAAPDERLVEILSDRDLVLFLWQNLSAGSATIFHGTMLLKRILYGADVDTQQLLLEQVGAWPQELDFQRKAYMLMMGANVDEEDLPARKAAQAELKEALQMALAEGQGVPLLRQLAEEILTLETWDDETIEGWVSENEELVQQVVAGIIDQIWTSSCTKESLAMAVKVLSLKGRKIGQLKSNPEFMSLVMQEVQKRIWQMDDDLRTQAMNLLYELSESFVDFEEELKQDLWAQFWIKYRGWDDAMDAPEMWQDLVREQVITAIPQWVYSLVLSMGETYLYQEELMARVAVLHYLYQGTMGEALQQKAQHRLERLRQNFDKNLRAIAIAHNDNENATPLMAILQDELLKPVERVRSRHVRGRHGSFSGAGFLSGNEDNKDLSLLAQQAGELRTLAHRRSDGGIVYHPELVKYPQVYARVQIKEEQLRSPQGGESLLQLMQRNIDQAQALAAEWNLAEEQEALGLLRAQQVLEGTEAQNEAFLRYERWVVILNLVRYETEHKGDQTLAEFWTRYWEDLERLYQDGVLLQEQGGHSFYQYDQQLYELLAAQGVSGLARQAELNAFAEDIQLRWAA